MSVDQCNSRSKSRNATEAESLVRLCSVAILDHIGEGEGYGAGPARDALLGLAARLTIAAPNLRHIPLDVLAGAA